MSCWCNINVSFSKVSHIYRLIMNLLYIIWHIFVYIEIYRQLFHKKYRQLSHMLYRRKLYSHTTYRQTLHILYGKNVFFHTTYGKELFFPYSIYTNFPYVVWTTKLPLWICSNWPNKLYYTLFYKINIGLQWTRKN